MSILLIFLNVLLLDFSYRLPRSSLLTFPVHSLHNLISSITIAPHRIPSHSNICNIVSLHFWVGVYYLHTRPFRVRSERGPNTQNTHTSYAGSLRMKMYDIHSYVCLINICIYIFYKQYMYHLLHLPPPKSNGFFCLASKSIQQTIVKHSQTKCQQTYWRENS